LCTLAGRKRGENIIGKALIQIKNWGLKKVFVTFFKVKGPVKSRRGKIWVSKVIQSRFKKIGEIFVC